MPYHSRGVYWKPRYKKDFINCIVQSGRWNDTKSKLMAMDIKQIAGIYHRIRQDQFKDLMIKPIVQDGYIPEQKMEV